MTAEFAGTRAQRGAGAAELGGGRGMAQRCAACSDASGAARGYWQAAMAGGAFVLSDDGV